MTTATFKPVLTNEPGSFYRWQSSRRQEKTLCVKYSFHNCGLTGNGSISRISPRSIVKVKSSLQPFFISWACDSPSSNADKITWQGSLFTFLISWTKIFDSCMLILVLHDGGRPFRSKSKLSPCSRGNTDETGLLVGRFQTAVHLKTLCLLQSAAGEQGAEGQSGRAPVGSGEWSPPCGRSRDLPQERRAEPGRGPETQRGAAERLSAVSHQTSSYLTVVFRSRSTQTRTRS